MSLYLARRMSAKEVTASEVWEGLDVAYGSAERLIDRFQHACKPAALTPVKLPLSAFFEDRRKAWSEILETRGRRLVLRPPEAPESAGLFDPMRLTQGLDDLVAWRAAVGESTHDLRVAWSAIGGEFQLVWDEPVARSLAPRSASAMTARCWETQTLAAFALPLLTRIMMSHGGSLETDGFTADQWRLTMRWPLDARPITKEKPPCSASPLHH